MTRDKQKDKQKNFRLTAAEDRKIQKAAQTVGLTDSQWIRLVVLTALGETALLEQLDRAAHSGRQVARKRRRPGRQQGTR